MGQTIKAEEGGNQSWRGQAIRATRGRQAKTEDANNQHIGGQHSKMVD